LRIPQIVDGKARRRRAGVTSSSVELKDSTLEREEERDRPDVVVTLVTGVDAESDVDAAAEEDAEAQTRRSTQMRH
jgi:hypothetical protein